MTAPDPSPACPQEPSSQAAGAVDKRSRKVYVLWAIALTLLLALGVFCWTVVVPFFEIRAAVVRCAKDRDVVKTEVENLGGPERAAAKTTSYLRWPLS
jgi:hypothetical protein